MAFLFSYDNGGGLRFILYVCALIVCKAVPQVVGAPIVVERYYKNPEMARELELFDPSWFAGETEIVLGKKSGKYSILYELRKRGIVTTDEKVNDVLNQVKRLSIEKKGLVSNKEFEEILSKSI